MLADFENYVGEDLEDIVLAGCRLYFSHGFTIFIIGNSCRRSSDFENDDKSEDLEDIVLSWCRPVWKMTRVKKNYKSEDLENLELETLKMMARVATLKTFSCPGAGRRTPRPSRTEQSWRPRNRKSFKVRIFGGSRPEGDV